ncbi:hypothetical protein MicloDRAFT_00028910 [Microvirga lotononidis]|uniref:Uncharacterized protein n=1 Tax=Microvirga lotononidis TaxID=864069 RepID=I4YQV0_9HYPH|nr:hypothetical protein MicloDRAFT_00028910 [Microvirga lotononidis]
MPLHGVAAVTMIALVGLMVQADAQAPCQDYLRLRNADSGAWGHKSVTLEPLRSLASCLLGRGDTSHVRRCIS